MKQILPEENPLMLQILTAQEINDPRFEEISRKYNAIRQEFRHIVNSGHEALIEKRKREGI